MDKKTLGLNYYADMKDAPVSDLSRQTNIKTKNQLMVFSYCSWKDCLETDRSTGASIIFINLGQLIMSHILQYQLLNQMHKVITIQHVLQKRVQQISIC